MKRHTDCLHVAAAFKGHGASVILHFVTMSMYIASHEIQRLTAITNVSVPCSLLSSRTRDVVTIDSPPRIKIGVVG